MSLTRFSNWRSLSILLLALLVSPPIWADKSYSDIFIFGDSLSDTGNYASIAGDLPDPPYFNNRITNGLTAVDVIAKSLNLNAKASLYLLGLSSGGNYAVNGARAAGEETNDFSAQIMAFLANKNGSAPSDALYVVFIGSNDVFDASIIPDNTIANLYVDNAVFIEQQQIQLLINAGVKHLLVINVVDISNTPAITFLAKVTQKPQLIKHANYLAKRYNKKLKHVLKEISHNNEIELVRFDLFKAFNHLLDHAPEAGFTNITNACFSSATLSYYPGCNYAKFSKYIFFDEIHPTARVHKIIGNLVVDQLNNKKISDLVIDKENYESNVKTRNFYQNF
ncbi:MAG: SGNH/GDSL hydrolase family protein [Thiohalomonadales bacterium]